METLQHLFLKHVIKKSSDFNNAFQRSLMLGLLFSIVLMLPCLALPGLTANLVPDPSFENGTGSWDLDDYASSIDSSVARTGSQSLKLTNDASASNHNAGQYSISDVQAGVEYQYDVWVRGDNVTGVGAGGKPLAVIRWRNSNGNKIAKEMYIWAPYGTYDWRQKTIYLQAPSNADKVDISFRSWYDCLTGTTNWDDISLSPRDLSHRGSLSGTYQAENADTISGGQIESSESNYTGSGYFHATTDDAYLQWNNVSGGTNGGTRILSFRYALEGNEKNWQVLVNGASQGIVKPTATGQINSWASSDWQVNLQPGDNIVRVRVVNVSAGPLIDKLDVYFNSGATPTASTPTITPNGGSFTDSVQVSLQSSTPGTTIYYTTDGATPTTGSTQYTAPFTLTATATVKAIAVASGYNDSAVASATFTKTVTPTAATPTITPNGGSFTDSVQVSLQTSTPGATIYYTTDGATPTTGSTLYTAPFTLTATTTVNAIATASGYNNSAVASATFTKSTMPAAAAPTITPNGGSFTDSVQVSLQTSTPGATIYYTTNGTTPTTGSTLYTAPFTLTADTTVKAIATAAGYNDSAVTSADFLITTGGQQPYGGTPWPIPGTIEAEDYDTGGEAVAYHDNSAGNSGAEYRNDDVDIWVSGDTGGGYYIGSNTSDEWLEYTVNVENSGQYSLDLRVATPNDGCVVHVEVDGTDVTGQIAIPNTGAWNVWQLVMTTVNLTQAESVVRVVFDVGGLNLNWIDIYSIGLTVSTPTITPNGGDVTFPIDVELDTTTAGATIYYTTDESTPTAGSTQYTTPFTLTTDTVVNAFAVAADHNDSAVASATFTDATGEQPSAGGSGGGCFISTAGPGGN